MIERRIRELQTLAEKVRRNEQEGLEQLRAVITKYKLMPAHLRIAMRGMATQRSTRIRPKAKIAPKYRSPYNPEIVWSGRGRKPSWLVSALKNGRNIDEFLIQVPQEEPSDRSSAVR
jgi:DNA-binding protein H-NS